MSLALIGLYPVLVLVLEGWKQWCFGLHVSSNILYFLYIINTKRLKWSFTDENWKWYSFKSHDVSVRHRREKREEKVGESIFRAGANPFFYKFTQTKRSILFISVAWIYHVSLKCQKNTRVLPDYPCSWGKMFYARRSFSDCLVCVLLMQKHGLANSDSAPNYGRASVAAYFCLHMESLCVNI